MHVTENPTASSKPFRNSVFITEMVICAVLILIFCGMFVQTREWPEQAALFPRLISIMGVLSTSAYLIQQVLRQSRQGSIRANRILDVPWAKVDGDAREIKRTAIGVVGAMAAFWIGIVLIGFHASALIYLFSQLVIYGKMRVWVAALSSVAVLAGIVLIYDELADTTWNDPVLLDWVKTLVGM